MAEGASGWEAGVVGAGAIKLNPREVGVAAEATWLLTADLSSTENITLFVRADPMAEPKAVNLGDLAPSAAAVVGDKVYLTGFRFGSENDPGIVVIDLPTSSVETVIDTGNTAGLRYLAAGVEGTTLTSTLCDPSRADESHTCDLLTVTLSDLSVHQVGIVQGGILRGSSSTHAVIAPEGNDAPSWLAGVDLQTGGEIWRITGDEFGPSLMSRSHGFIVSEIVLGGPEPRLVVDRIDVSTGLRSRIYSETSMALGTIWPELSTDGHIAIGRASSLRRALASEDGVARIVLVALDTGQAVEAIVPLRGGL